jgi:hypothetical protein
MNAVQTTPTFKTESTVVSEALSEDLPADYNDAASPEAFKVGPF